MRILFVSRRFFPAISGMSVYAANLLRELVALGHDVTMLSQFRGDAAGRGVYGGGPPPPVPGVRVIGMEARGEQDGGDFERDIDELADVAEALHEEAPFDLVHAQYGYPTGLAAMIAARRIARPCVVSVQGGDGHWIGDCCALHRQAMEVVLDHADAVLIGSASFRDEVVARLGTDPARFTIVPGAVDTARFSPGAAVAPRRLLYHGRVDRRKGVLDLLDAFALLRPERPSLELTVSGIGPDLEAARERAGRGVDLLGSAAYDDVPAILRGGGLFVSPTHAEGFSNTILEAMATGLPIVSTRAVGVVDCLRDGDNALLVDPGDVGALADAIGRMLDDEVLREDLAATALAEVRERYAWPVVARRIAAVYAAVRARPRARGWEVPTGRPPCRFRAAPHLL